MSAAELIGMICIIAVVLTACHIGDPDPSGYHYVFRKGGPAAIGGWAVRQDDPERVWHALLALSSYTDPASHAAYGDEYVEAAADALVRINNRYQAGWTFMATAHPQANPMFIPGRCYDGLAQAATLNAYAKSQFLAVEPRRDSELHAQWVMVGMSKGLLP